MEASPGIGNFSHHLQKNPVRDPLNAIEVSGDNLALFVPHSGRWVGFKQSSLVQSGRKFAKAVGLNREDRVNMNLSLASVTGKAAGLFGVLDQMSCLVLPDRSFSAETTVESFSNEVCNTLMVTPAQLQEVLELNGMNPAKVDGLQKLIVVSDDGSLPSADQLTQAKSLLGASDIRVAVGSSGAAPFLVSGSGDPLSLQALQGAQVPFVFLCVSVWSICLFVCLSSLSLSRTALSFSLCVVCLSVCLSLLSLSLLSLLNSLPSSQCFASDNFSLGHS